MLKGTQLPRQKGDNFKTVAGVYGTFQDSEANNFSTSLKFEGDELDESSLLDIFNPNSAKNSCSPCPEVRRTKMAAGRAESRLDPIKCAVNGEYTIDCRKDNNEVYGAKRKIKGREVFEFNYSYGKVNAPTPSYDPGGAFLNFKFYHVEVRGMLQCVTASEGVPLAVQWNPQGYFYAIAVAQFGLAHHAKGVIDGNPVPKLLSDGRSGSRGWKLPPKVKGCKVTTATDYVNGIKRKVVAFIGPESMNEKGPTMTLNSHDLALCVSVRMLGPGGLTVEVKVVDGSSGFVHFTHGDFYMEVEGRHVTLGMRSDNLGTWMRLSRDLDIDYSKGMKKSKQVTKVVSVTLHGKGYIDNMTLAASAHNENLMHAADWLLTSLHLISPHLTSPQLTSLHFMSTQLTSPHLTSPDLPQVKNQDARGGWPTSTAMHTAEIKLPPNWYSAMGQGQAMSALVRAHNLTGDCRYLAAAERALHLYTLGSEEGGVRARFLGQLDWYEEYPTVPTSSFVLNGFIFSMMGLYDVMKTSRGKPQKLAQKLWDAGMKSLKFMLGMYDTGAGTLYDLRHVINHEPPNRARWDYHRTHIALIHEMAIVDGDPIFWEAWARWKGYLKGIRSDLNKDYGDILS
ncbi:hypothetical protein EGW08_003543 [Elysia chlorotica]|uniref:heparosan-N-sulfate-glucuronate 5-epimerase n=1 Tax=Elysia chlorotica TaxID=188477 RepID=A0A433U4L6_ELYCH|nr:hypothetical protein EGW08_003543 [Elysia chlorotica]